MSGPDDFYQTDLSALPLGVAAPPPDAAGKPWGGALLRGGLRGALPATGGFAGAVGGAELFGAGGGAVGGPIGALGGGILGAGLGGFGLGFATDKAQTYAADAVTGGAFSRQRSIDEAEHPYASFIGQAVPNLLFLRPSTRLALGARAFGAAFGGGVEAGSEYAQSGTVDPGKVALATGFGATLDSETALGRAIAARTHPLVQPITRGAGATIERIGANATVANALRDAPDADAHVAQAAAGPADPNLSPATRDALSRARAMQAALGDRQTPDELAAGHTIENDAQVEASNPFVATPESLDLHGQSLAAATEALLADAPFAMPDPARAVRDWQMPEIQRGDWHQAIRQQESGGDQRLVSPKGAKGAMQVMDGTARDPGYGVAPARDGSLAERDRVGSDLLDAYNRHYGNELLATAAYNAGPARLEGWTDKAGQHHPGWLQTIGDPRTGEISYAQFAERIPIKETRDYVRDVFRRMAQPIPQAPIVRPELAERGVGDVDAPIGDPQERLPGQEGAGAQEDVALGAALAGAPDADRYAADLDIGRTLARSAPEANEGPASLPVSLPDEVEAQAKGYADARSGLPAGEPVRASYAAGHQRGRFENFLEANPALSIDEANQAFRSADQPAPAAPIKTVRPRARSGPSGPVDVNRFLAERGGIRDDEGHSLGKEGALSPVTGRRRSGRDLQQQFPGVGPLIRKSGMSIDEAGELLHEAGYVTGDRPTVADVLDLLERANGEKIYPAHEQAEMDMRARAELEQQHFDARRDDVARVAEDLGLPLDDVDLDRAAGLADDGMDHDQAVRAIAAERANDEILALRSDHADIASFDDPDGDAADLQLQSLEHDFAMELHDPGAGDVDFRLNDEGEAATLADILAQSDEEERAAVSLRACMTPGAQP